MSSRTRFILLAILAVCVLALVIGVPVNKRPDTPSTTTPKGPEDPADEDWANLEYYRYLQEVINVIETDPAMKEKFQNASEDDIKVRSVVNVNLLLPLLQLTERRPAFLSVRACARLPNEHVDGWKMVSIFLWEIPRRVLTSQTDKF